MIIELKCKVCGKKVKTRRSPAGLKISKPKYCSQKCNGINKHNNKKGATPNVFYYCLSCGKNVATYRSPSARKSYIPKFCSLKCVGLFQKGSNNPAWKGGKYKDSNGYINIFMPDHPYTNVKGYIYEHRFIVEQTIGRYLLPKEVVHHIDGDKKNNNPENLKLFNSSSEHLKYHNKGE